MLYSDRDTMHADTHAADRVAPGARPRPRRRSRTPAATGPAPVSSRASVRRLLAGGTALAAAVLLAACGGAPPATPASATYQIAPRTVRPSETPLPATPVTDGDTAFELLGLTTDLRSVLGSHAEWPAKGRFVRIRLAVTNNGRTSVLLDTARQQLVATDGVARSPDPQAMLIKRQPVRLDVGAGDRFEFDLYYDIPVGAGPVTLRAFGGPTLADFGDTVGIAVPVVPDAPPPTPISATPGPPTPPPTTAGG